MGLAGGEARYARAIALTWRAVDWGRRWGHWGTVTRVGTKLRPPSLAGEAKETLDGDRRLDSGGAGITRLSGARQRSAMLYRTTCPRPCVRSHTSRPICAFEVDPLDLSRLDDPRIALPGITPPRARRVGREPRVAALKGEISDAELRRRRRRLRIFLLSASKRTQPISPPSQRVDLARTECGSTLAAGGTGNWKRL
jgi:hypothetical protein